MLLVFVVTGMIIGGAILFVTRPLHRVVALQIGADWDWVPCTACNEFGVTKLGGIPFKSGDEIEQYGPGNRTLCQICQGNKVIVRPEEW